MEHIPPRNAAEKCAAEKERAETGAEEQPQTLPVFCENGG